MWVPFLLLFKTTHSKIDVRSITPLNDISGSRIGTHYIVWRGCVVYFNFPHLVIFDGPSDDVRICYIFSIISKMDNQFRLRYARIIFCFTIYVYTPFLLPILLPNVWVLFLRGYTLYNKICVYVYAYILHVHVRSFVLHGLFRMVIDFFSTRSTVVVVVLVFILDNFFILASILNYLTTNRV